MLDGPRICTPCSAATARTSLGSRTSSETTAAAKRGLTTLRAELEEALEEVRAAPARWPQLEHRVHLLKVNNRYAQRLLELQLEWLDEAERTLRRG